jgi:hypothetical protein
MSVASVEGFLICIVSGGLAFALALAPTMDTFRNLINGTGSQAAVNTFTVIWYIVVAFCLLWFFANFYNLYINSKSDTDQED